MKIKKWTLVLVAALLQGLTATLAMAGNFYGAVDIGGVEAPDACNGLPGFTCTNSEVAYRIATGYQFDPTWGIEISYGDLGKSKLSGVASGVVTNEETRISAAQAVVTGAYWVSQSLSLIGKFGIGTTVVKQSGTSAEAGFVASSTANATSTRLTYGIGAQYAVTQALSVRAQYESLGNVGNDATGTAKIALISMGVVTKF